MKLFFALAIVLICKFVQPNPLWMYEDEKSEQDPIPETDVQEDPFLGSHIRGSVFQQPACRQCRQQNPFHHFPGKKDEDTENDPIAKTEADEEIVQKDPIFGVVHHANRLPCCKPKRQCRQCHLPFHHFPGKKDENTEEDPIKTREEDEENVQKDPFFFNVQSIANLHVKRLPCC